VGSTRSYARVSTWRIWFRVLSQDCCEVAYRQWKQTLSAPSGRADNCTFQFTLSFCTKHTPHSGRSCSETSKQVFWRLLPSLVRSSGVTSSWRCLIWISAAIPTVCGLTQSLQVNVGMFPCIRPLPVPSTCSPICNLLSSIYSTLFKLICWKCLWISRVYKGLFSGYFSVVFFLPLFPSLLCRGQEV